MSEITAEMNRMKKYIPLLRQLVLKDIKLKYRRSVLGYLWSVLNPLMIMMIMVVVFSHMFRSNIENYPVYLLSGQIIFNFYSESTNQAIHSVVGNAPLLKKTYVPKYIFPFAKITSGLTNLIFSLGALFIVCLFCGCRVSASLLLIPAALLEAYIFSLGAGFLLAAANVFFRDIQYIYTALITAWTYFTPLFYPVDMLPDKIRLLVIYGNPLYSYIAQMRRILLDGAVPEASLYIVGGLWAAAALAAGVWVFKKTENNFILYI